jgi:hypothetical protein
MVGEEERLFSGTFFALDGCKLSSNASKQSSGAISGFERKQEKVK